MKVRITDTLTEYLLRVGGKGFNMEKLGESVKDSFIGEMMDYGEVPFESGALMVSPTKYSTVKSTGYRANINIVYKGDAPYSYRVTRPWTDFLPNKDYAAYQHENVPKNRDYLREPFDVWTEMELGDVTGAYFRRFLLDNIK